MRTTKPDAPAFPCPTLEKPGMTMREWYAGMAMIGVLQFAKANDEQLTPEEVAEDAFATADAMLAQAAKPQEDR